MTGVKMAHSLKKNTGARMLGVGEGRAGFLLSVFLSFCLSALLFSVNCPLSYADKIYLKDGKSYEGKLIGRSHKRYLFSVDADGEYFRMSFFPDSVEKIELDKDTVEEQIPYLKEVEDFSVDAKDDKSKAYQISLYKGGSQAGDADSSKFSLKELKGRLDKQENEYYAKFNGILDRYVDKSQFIQNLYLNLTVATREDFARARQYMDELYFELNNIFVPDAFKRSHAFYLEYVKASYLTFQALLSGMLDEASKQIKISEEAKERSALEFRDVITSRKPEGVVTGKNAGAEQ